jgi:hypothetical protein
MTDIAGLIERLEKATEPDVFLDAAIRKALDMPLEAPITSDCPRYTASIDAALALAEKLHETHWYSILLDAVRAFGVAGTLGPDHLARYILIATLRALLSQEKANG